MEGMPRFIVEVGSLHGHSAIQMASVLDKLQMTEAGIRSCGRKVDSWGKNSPKNQGEDQILGGLIS